MHNNYTITYMQVNATVLFCSNIYNTDEIMQL